MVRWVRGAAQQPDDDTAAADPDPPAVEPAAVEPDGVEPADVEPAGAARPSAPSGAERRLVERPVFVMSSPRSGSTMLRKMLDAHSAVCAPHELHLRQVGVTLGSEPAQAAMEAAGLSVRELEHLLWDQILHRELVLSGKRRVVSKTPGDVLMWKRVLEAWPGAQFVYLRRHPLAVADSWRRMRGAKQLSVDEAGHQMRKYFVKMDAALAAHPGPVVRYEDLVADPVAETTRICEHLGVPFEAGMLEFGASTGPLTPGLGDRSSRLQSGQVQAARPLPDDDVPPTLRQIAEQWGYLSDAR